MHYSTLRGVVHSYLIFIAIFHYLPAFMLGIHHFKFGLQNFPTQPQMYKLPVKNSELESLVLRNMKICSPQCSLSHLIQASVALNRTSTILSHTCNIELPLEPKSLHIRKEIRRPFTKQRREKTQKIGKLFIDFNLILF